MKTAFRDAVAAYLRAHPGEWIDGERFRDIGGRYAYRTRLSECRTQLGMTVENRVRRIPGSEARCSEYRYVPPVVPQQADLFGKETAA